MASALPVVCLNLFQASAQASVGCLPESFNLETHKPWELDPRVHRKSCNSIGSGLDSATKTVPAPVNVVVSKPILEYECIKHTYLSRNALQIQGPVEGLAITLTLPVSHSKTNDASGARQSQEEFNAQSTIGSNAKLEK